MRIPNAHKAVVEIAKLRDYCLNMRHPEGRHKARVFHAALGLTSSEADLLRSALLAAAQDHEATEADKDQYGQRYTIDFVMRHGDCEAVIRSAWIIRTQEDFPRLTSCFVL